MSGSIETVGLEFSGIVQCEGVDVSVVECDSVEFSGIVSITGLTLDVQGVPTDFNFLTTEGGDFLTTEGGDRLVLEY